MFKRITALTLVLGFMLLAFACKDKNQDGITGTQPSSNPASTSGIVENGENTEKTFPPVELKDGWPVEGILSKLPAYKHGGDFDQPIMPDTHIISNSSKADFDAYCKDLENAGFEKSEDTSANEIARYVYKNTSLNLLVTVAYWTDYKEIEILAENLDGSIDYSVKETLNVVWSDYDYLKLIPQYTMGGRIIELSTSREENSQEDFIKIVDASLKDYDSYKSALLDAGFVQGSAAHEGWHDEAFYYSHPDIPSFTVELYYEKNGLTTDNIVIGISALGKAIA